MGWHDSDGAQRAHLHHHHRDGGRVEVHICFTSVGTGSGLRSLEATVLCCRPNQHDPVLSVRIFIITSMTAVV